MTVLGTDRAIEPDQLVQRAIDLQPLLARHAAQVDAERRIPEEVVQAIADAGLLRLGVPRRFDGFETTIRTQLQVSAALGEACGSTGWVVQNLNASCVVGGLFGDRAQQDVWGADPQARLCGSMAPTKDVRRVDEGWVVSGKWPWLSGADHAQWAFLGFPLVDAEGVVTDMGFGLVPLSAGEIEDTWFVTGMRGTASNTLVLRDVLIPEHRVLSGMRAIEGEFATEHTDEALYRVSLGPMLILILVGSQLGLGAAALSLVRAQAGRRGITYTSYATQSESVGFQIQVAEAAMRIESARLHAFRAADAIDAAAAAGRQLPYPERARIRAEAAWACDQLRDAVQTLIDAHGASTFAEANPLQRIWRDLNAASRHAMLTSQIGLELYGKALLGREERISPLL